MLVSDDLLEQLNKTPTSELAAKESTKNKLADAHADELITQSKNRSILGQFIVYWLMAVLSISSFLILAMCLIDVYYLVQDQVKIEQSLRGIYSSFKQLISENKVILGVIGGLIFGNKINIKDKDKDKS